MPRPYKVGKRDVPW